MAEELSISGYDRSLNDHRTLDARIIALCWANFLRLSVSVKRSRSIRYAIMSEEWPEHWIPPLERTNLQFVAVMDMVARCSHTVRIPAKPAHHI
jgi:hypothetical protein